MRFVPECEQMDEPFDPLDCLVPLPDAEVVVESLGPLLEGPIPPFDVVPDAERQGHPVHVQPLEGACVPWGVVDYEQRLPPARLQGQLHGVYG